MRLWHFPILLALAGCALARGPLYSPLSDNGAFGYTEEWLSGDRIRVRYVAPRTTTFVLNRFDNTALADERLALAKDIALLRAADVAVQSGWQSFAVVSRGNDTQVDVIRERSAFRSYSFVRRSYRYDPFYADRFGYTPYAEVTAAARLTIERSDEPDALDARATLERLRRQYANELPPPEGL